MSTERIIIQVRTEDCLVYLIEHLNGTYELVEKRDAHQSTILEVYSEGSFSDAMWAFGEQVKELIRDTKIKCDPFVSSEDRYWNEVDLAVDRAKDSA